MHANLSSSTFSAVDGYPSDDDSFCSVHSYHGIINWSHHSLAPHGHFSEEEIHKHSFFVAGINIVIDPPIKAKKPSPTSNSASSLSPRPYIFDLAKVVPIVDNEMAASTAQAPGSPPGLTASKSSKSSSFHSSSLSGPDGLLSDITHFEDIGLDEDPVPSTKELYGYESPTKRPALRENAVTMSGSRSNTIATTNMRELTNGRTRPTLPNQYIQTKETSGLGISNPLIIPGPNGARRGFRSPSTPSLAQKAMRNLSRSRSPSPSHQIAGSPMPQLLPRQTFPIRSPVLPVGRKPPMRRGSWQPGRKSVKELEDEYNDLDEDLPDDANLWNVPLSPRPPPERLAMSPRPSPTPSTNTSPERPSSFNPSKGSLKDLHPPRTAPAGVASKEFARKPGCSPVRQAYPLNTSTSSMPDQCLFLKSRAKSWTVAMSELSEEAKNLTQALENHADQSERQYEEAIQSGVASARPSTDKKARAKSSVELPPLRLNNVMIDPLPISKEKEKVLSRTRPSWLPPKDQKEERRHLKEYERMMTASLEAERRKAAKAAVAKCAEDDTKNALLRIWEEHVLPNWDQAVSESRTRELWWRGVAPRSRAKVWPKAIGNDLALTETTYTKALQRAKDAESRISASRNNDPPKEKAWFDAIRRDVKVTFPELNIFGLDGPLHDGLVDVLMAYSMYRSDVGYSHGTHLIAALLLLTCHTPTAAFLNLANLLNRPLPLAFLTGEPSSTAKAYSLVDALLSHKYPRLHAHLFSQPPEEGGLGLHAAEVFEPLMRTLFLGPGAGLGIDAASRVWDVMVFDGDAMAVRTAVGILGMLEGRLYGGREEVLGLLGWNGGKGKGEWGIGADVEGFMKVVRAAGKENKERQGRG
ncbi:MAG: hypothetical protein LQ342_004507 [Letrouitia transgressa]|nr:MAG: hypothetical protein LQ342_004507 [Letrouitia transgressa]